MNRPVPTQIGSLVMVVGLTGLARPAAAECTPTLTIVLQVPGHGSVPPHIVNRAKTEMRRIYRDAGVNIIWINAASSAGRPDPRQSRAAFDPGFALVVLPREMSDELAVATKALGGAAGTPEQRGRMAYVFYSRVEPSGKEPSLELFPRRVARAYWVFNAAQVANFTDPIASVFRCIGLLGASGCGFEQPLASIDRALGADGLGPPPAQNEGFLRQVLHLREFPS